MSDYYRGKRSRNIYNPESEQAFRLSRSKLELYIECPRCFYIDRRLGVDRPPGYPFSINSAVDKLLKKEFDIHRARVSRHPLMEAYGINAIPAAHKKLDDWRNNFTGVEYFHEPSNFIVTGAIDDLWQNKNGEYMVVDYKATSKEGKITELDMEWQDSYKRQMEIYQWLLRKNVEKVSDLGYFVYCNGRTDVKAFDGRIEFDVTLISYKGNDAWVERAVTDAKACLDKKNAPKSSPNCDYCRYRDDVASVL